MRTKFKQYNQAQQFLLPPSLDEMISQNHPVRVLDKIINEIDISEIENNYTANGASSYNPRMLLKVIVYAYMNNIYSSRRIENLIKENIYYMWLSGMQKPDHNTINRFRSKRLSSGLKEVFSKIVMLFNKSGFLDIKEIYTDGTKLEANANKYSFVWGKSIQRRREQILQQINELWAYATEVGIAEMQDVRPQSYEEITSENISATISEINNLLIKKKIDKKVRAKLTRVKKAWPEQLRNYELSEQLLQGRNSYSKTDTDAIFMRMKDDHMKNGQLKPGYNWQISTNNQIIINYSIHQTAGDTSTLIEHLETYKTLYSSYPHTITADAGYGSHENYKYAEDKEIEAYIKYNYFHKEQNQNWRKDISKSDNLYYNKEQDSYYCPMGQRMEKIEERESKSANGYVQTISKYRAKNCEGCPLRGACHKSIGNRTIEINQEAKRLRSQAKERLMSEEGFKKRRRRPIEPETVFGNIKHNKQFRQFLLRGKEKVEIEVGLLSIAHNMSKISSRKVPKV
jgi:transposase